MRRLVATLLLVIGCWWLASEMAIAFLDLKPGLADNALMIGVVALFAAVALGLGTWASPGDRRRELGLTMLIATGITLFMIASVAVTVMDRAFMRYMPAMPEIDFAPAVGVVNLLAIGAVGWWLHRGARA